MANPSFYRKVHIEDLDSDSPGRQSNYTMATSSSNDQPASNKTKMPEFHMSTQFHGGKSSATPIVQAQPTGKSTKLPERAKMVAQFGGNLNAGKSGENMDWEPLSHFPEQPPLLDSHKGKGKAVEIPTASSQPSTTTTRTTPQRRLVTLRTVSEITKANRNARYEVVHVGGWTVLARKKQFAVGQLVVFFEIDAFVPASDGRF
jgi:hypothetical protein